MRVAAIAITALLSGCLAPNVFYTGQLSEHDQSIFAEAASVEGVEVVEWPVPGVWIVAYGSPLHSGGVTGPSIIFIDRQQPQWTGCPRDQGFLVISRHEIRHSQGTLEHSTWLMSVMHDPAPCWPED
mgnify:CR=1 FL=1